MSEPDRHLAIRLDGSMSLVTDVDRNRWRCVSSIHVSEGPLSGDFSVYVEREHHVPTMREVATAAVEVARRVRAQQGVHAHTPRPDEQRLIDLAIRWDEGGRP